MNKNSINDNAGIVWRVLNCAGRQVSYQELKRASHLSDMDLWIALGWLAREDKIAIEHAGQSLFFQLDMDIYFA